MLRLTFTACSSACKDRGLSSVGSAPALSRRRLHSFLLDMVSLSLRSSNPFRVRGTLRTWLISSHRYKSSWPITESAPTYHNYPEQSEFGATSSISAPFSINNWHILGCSIAYCKSKHNRARSGRLCHLQTKGVYPVSCDPLEKPHP